MKKLFHSLIMAIAAPALLLAQPPLAPVITSPTTGASVSTSQPVISGSESTSPAVVEVYANENYIGAVFNDTSTPNWSLLSADYNTTLTPGATFTLTATAANDAGTGPISAPVSITVLDVPVITSPSTNGVSTALPTFSGTTPLGTQVQVFQGSTLLGNAVVNGSNWTFTPSQALTPGVYTFTAVATSSTAITEFPTLELQDTTAKPFLITQGPDGNLWFTYNDVPYVGKITPNGDITNYSVTEAGKAIGTEAITTGPDGLLYFTVPGTTSVPNDAYVGSITVDGTVAKLDIPDLELLAKLPGITTGPDGQIWFIETSPTASIWSYNITTQESTQYMLSNNDMPANPSGLTTGPDARLWFTSGNQAVIGAFDVTDKTATYYEITSGNLSSAGIAAGPDGNIWFTEFVAGKIGVMSTSGENQQEFDTTSETSQPTVITAGSDGNLWFTEFAADTIGRITPAGVVTPFPIPTQSNTVGAPVSGPIGITNGPDGDIWFADNVGANIGTMGTGLTGTSAAVTLAVGLNAFANFLFNKYCLNFEN